MWPCCWGVVSFFASIGDGDWCWSANGRPIGVRLEAAREVREALGISNDSWRDMFQDFRVMETAARDKMNETISMQQAMSARRGGV